MFKMRKKVFGLVVAITMFFGLSVTAMAAETLEPIVLDGLHDCKIVLSESQVNEPRSSGGTTSPVFYSGQVYGYNSNTNATQLAGEAMWKWGVSQPDYLEVLKQDYWDMSAAGYDYWHFKYTWNSKDCTYLKIYERGSSSNVFIDTTVKPNTDYNISFYVKSLTSTVKLTCDYILPGVIVSKDTPIGGLKVIY